MNYLIPFLKVINLDHFPDLDQVTELKDYLGKIK